MRHSVLVVSIFVAIEAAVASESAQHTLTFEDRVKAQKAIEQVYWGHRIWPSENPGPKPPLSAVMSDDAIRAKVEDYLKKSNALERWWQRPITGEQLQAEMDRMAKGSRDAQVLGELFAVLRNDPCVIAETLARQTLADRLIRNWYANDTRFHADTRAKAEAALATCDDVACLESVGGDYHETTVTLRTTDAGDRDGVEHAASLGGGALQTRRLSDLKETAESFSVVGVLAVSHDKAQTASVHWPKTVFDAWWSSHRTLESSSLTTAGALFVLPAITSSGCAKDTWASTFSLSSDGKPAAVWTGTELIISGLGRYNPAIDSWMGFAPRANKPGARWSPTAVWSGTEMIIWGGRDVSGYLNTGARYNPTTDSWTPTSTGTNVPLPRDHHTAIWTGTQMIIWGGYSPSFPLHPLQNTGGRYDPSKDSWTPTSTAAGVPSARENHSAVWTGTELIVWGGDDDLNFLNTGGRYNPSTDTWLATSTGVNTPSVRKLHTAIWTGTQMIVWGGHGASGYLNTGARYTPSADTWVPTSTGAGVPDGRESHTSVWTGTEMIVWGGFGLYGYGFMNSGGRFDPSTDNWLATSTGANVPAARRDHTAVWTGTEMLVWGGQGTSNNLNSGGRYSPGTDTWTPTSPTGNVPSVREEHTALWTGAEVIVWGGWNDQNPYNTGGRYNPATDSWIPTSLGATVPSARVYHTAVWTGTEMIVWGGSLDRTGGRYNPTADTWAPTSTGANVPAARSKHSAVWTGREMIVWGGRNVGTLMNDGGRYNPSADSWVPTSTDGGVPAGRDSHTAIWTGTEMIVWGGNPGGQLELNTGARYRPETDTWAPTATTANTPQARRSHVAVWTGTEMIVWGGVGNFGDPNDGGRYNPSTDTWLATSTGANVPSGRQYHAAIWTGAEMIVWGGLQGSNSVNTGGRYSPSGDNWVPTSTGTDVPAARFHHTAVWTGTEMIVWGGFGLNGLVNTGGRYCACPSGQFVYHDADGDNYGDPAQSIFVCDGSVPTGYLLDHSDCDDANASVYPGAAEICDGIDDNCNGQRDEDSSGVDSDGDGVHNACDRCIFVWDPSQTDFDHNGVGDACDLNDGLIYLLGTDDKNRVEWQQEAGFTSWNVYEGDLAVLRATGTYTQLPGSNASANRACGIADTWVDDAGAPHPGKVKFSLVTGVAGGVESSLGTNSAGVPRANANPCP